MKQDEFAVVAIFPAINHRSLQKLIVQINSPDETSKKIYEWGENTSVDMSEEPLIKANDILEVHCTYGPMNESILVYVFN